MIHHFEFKNEISGSPHGIPWKSHLVYEIYLFIYNFATVAQKVKHFLGIEELGTH